MSFSLGGDILQFSLDNSPEREPVDAFERRVTDIVRSCSEKGDVGFEALRGNTLLKQGLLLSALCSGVAEKEKVEFLFRTWDIRMSPDDVASAACAIAVARAKATGAVLKEATTAAGAASAAAADAPAYGAAGAAATDLRIAWNRVASFTVADLAANNQAGRALAADCFVYDGSALKCVVIGGRTQQLNLMVQCGMQVTPDTGARVIRDIVDFRYVCSIRFLRRFMECDGGVDLCYVYPPDDLTALSVAVKARRLDIVKMLLELAPETVILPGGRLGITPAHLMCNKCDHGCKLPNCDPDMSYILFRNGADASAQDSKGIHPILCLEAKKRIAERMDWRLHLFMRVLQSIYSGNCTGIIKRIPQEVMKHDVFRHLGWDPAMGRLGDSPFNRASLDRFPRFPRHPPVGWNVPRFLLEGGADSSSDSGDEA